MISVRLFDSNEEMLVFVMISVRLDVCLSVWHVKTLTFAECGGWEITHFFMLIFAQFSYFLGWTSWLYQVRIVKNDVFCQQVNK